MKKDLKENEKNCYENVLKKCYKTVRIDKGKLRKVLRKYYFDNCSANKMISLKNVSLNLHKALGGKALSRLKKGKVTMHQLRLPVCRHINNLICCVVAFTKLVAFTKHVR